MKRIIFILIAVMLLISGCTGNKIPSETSQYQSETLPLSDNTENVCAESDSIGKFEGSFLTMSRKSIDSAFPYAHIINAYNELETYFNQSEEYFIFGKRFTITCASFVDNFFKDYDIVMLAINEPSVYVSHTSNGISIFDDGSAQVRIERSIPKDIPKYGNIIYHLIFTVPKGSLDGVSDDKIEVVIDEVIDDKSNDVYDAERYRYIYPEFWPFTHPTEALGDSTATIASIQTYEELLSFYENYKTSFDLDKDFLRYIGSVYDEAMFDDYVLLISILPFNRQNPKPVVSDLFVYNLQIFLTIDNLVDEVPQDLTRWYVLAVAVDKKNLSGVNLKEFNIG